MKEMKRVLSFVLCLVMLVSMIPGTALTAFAAEGTPTIVVAGSDFQNSGGDTAGGKTVTSIMNQMGYSSVNGVLFGGDYSSSMSKSSNLTNLDGYLDDYCATAANRIYIQGNHDTNLSPSSSSNLLATEGGHDPEGGAYGVYAINHEDFPWSGSSSTLVQGTANLLKAYLDKKAADNYKKPIFVMSHLPLHYTNRGDNDYANLLFDVLNSYDDLNIIFLFGHNHSTAYDSYLGQGSIYLKKGDAIKVAKDGATSYSDETLNFTYMNYGYTGYIGSTNADATLTMTAFEIYEDEVVVKRYSTSGQHTLKAAGGNTQLPSGVSVNSDVYGQAAINLSTGESTISEISADSGDDTTGSGDTTGGSGWTYELVTSVEAGEKYVIVGNDDAVALMDSNGSFGSQTVTISGTTLTSDVALTEWTISGTSGGTIVSDQGNGLSYSSSIFNLTGAADNTFNISAGNDDNFTILTVRTNSSYSKYYFNYDGSGWTSKPTSAAYVRIYKLTGTGSGGGSTVTPEGGDWVTITDGKGQVVYELDTDGVIDTGVEYLIVAESYAKALSSAASAESAAVDITIDGNYAYTDSEDYGWIFTASGSDYTIRLNGSTYLGRSSSDLAEGDSGDTWTVEYESSGAYTITQESGSWGWGNTTYYVRWSNSNGYFQANRYNTDPVRLYKYVRTESAGDPEYAKLDGSLSYTVSRGASAEDALAAVKAGINVLTSASADGSNPTTLDDANTDITWTLAESYDGSIPGEYAVTISYKGVKLGTAKVIVPEATIVGYELVSYEGTVSKGASKAAETGTHIRVDVKDDEGEDYYVPVTVGMLTDANGNAPSTREIADITGLTVSYNGQTFENFTLHVVAKAGNNYPEYPDQGHVKVSKTGTGIEFQSTGIAQVEVSAFGIPMNQGVDVVIILDTSSSMRRDTFEASDGSQKTRIEILRPAVDELLQQLKTERPDGSDPDIDIAIATFNANTMATGNNYISDSGGDPAYSQTKDYGLLTGTTLSNAWVDIMSLDDDWSTQNSGANIPCTGSGTNYDYGLQMAYDLLAQKQADNSTERQQFVIFMSDGAPYQFNGVYSNGGETAWIDWVLANYDETDTETNNDIPDTVSEKNKTFYTGYAGNGQTHRIAEAIKGSPDKNFDIVTFENDSSGTLTSVPGLGATMYSIGLLLADESNNITAENQAAVLTKIASSEDKFFNITLASELTDAFTKFGNDVLMAAYDARYVDQMGDNYNLQLKPFVNYNGDPVDTDGDGEQDTSKIEILSYEVYTKAEADASAEITEDMIGNRKSTAPTVLETVTFSVDGKEAYSDLIYTEDGNGNKTYTNILIDGVICAKNFWYNTNATAVAIDGVDIPTGKDSANLTTGTTNMLPSETFYWKLGTLTNTELAMRYYVYLEGTREAGSFPTNEYATLYYDNYLENPCYKDTVSPVMAWKQANVSYAFYLVDKDGNIIVNQTTGETGTFANKIAVTNPVVYDEILLNNLEYINSIDVASNEEGVLPAGYELYDDQSVYTIKINSDSTGEWTIAKNTAKVSSTYVTQYDPNNAAAYSNELNKNSGADFTHTVVWFAVLWKVQALPDTVVIDYGLPVDISVLTNDMFGENGKLASVGAYSESLNLEGHDEALASGFGTTYTGTYGTAKADTSTGKVRYTVKDMRMNGYEKFAYAVNYTGNENAGYYYDTVTVIPATTIYYEDSFVEFDNLTWQQKVGGEAWEGEWAVVENPASSIWTQAGTTVSGATQDEDRPGRYSLTDANNIYGYDSTNLGMSQYSLGSAMKATVDYDNAAQASFTFWGTGFDVISMTDSTTGTIFVKVYDESGAKVKDLTVDTYYGYTYDLYNVTYTYTDGQWLKTVGSAVTDEDTVAKAPVFPEAPSEGEVVNAVEGQWVLTPNAGKGIWQVPVMEVEGLTYGRYEAVIQAIYEPAFDHDTSDTPTTYDFYLDAIRIYDPANDGAVDDDTVIEDAYKADGEGWPSYIELRNKLIDTNTLGNASTATKVEGLVFIDGNASVGDTAIKDYISYGPNNEVYLAPGQRVAFLLSTPDNIANVHIGIKSADGKSATCTITNIAKATNSETGVTAGDYYNPKTDTVDTATDMYYDLTGWKNDIIVISNTGDKYNTDGIISLTNIKSTYTSDPNATETTEAQTYGLRNASLELAAVGDQSYGLMTASEDVPETTVPDNIVEEKTVPELFETYIYMTPETASLVVDTLNAEEEPEVPEETEPEETVPETTVPEETEPEPTVPEETEPEDFEPAYVNVKLNKTTVKVGQKVLVTVTTSADVDYVIINDTVVTTYSTGFTGNRIWKRNVTGTAVGTMNIEVVCCNADDVAAEPVVQTVTVRRKTVWDYIWDLLG